MNNSQSLDKLCAQQINDLIEEYQDPEAAKYFLMETGIIDANGDLMPLYQPPTSSLEEWRAEGRGVMYF